MASQVVAPRRYGPHRVRSVHPGARLTRSIADPDLHPIRKLSRFAHETLATVRAGRDLLSWQGIYRATTRPHMSVLQVESRYREFSHVIHTFITGAGRAAGTASHGSSQALFRATQEHLHRVATACHEAALAECTSRLGPDRAWRVRNSARNRCRVSRTPGAARRGPAPPPAAERCPTISLRSRPAIAGIADRS